ncbi:MAG: GAF domain-containing protein [Pseudomonadota bacterium]
MSPTDADRIAHLTHCGEAAALPGQPTLLYDALSEATKALVGHKLFTMMFLDEARNEAARVYSNQPDAYPVGGRKQLGEMTGWGHHVLDGRQPYLGRTEADIKWAFFDYELIISLGCGSVINIPVIWDGKILGTMNLLDAENAYSEQDIEPLMPFAPLLIAPFLGAINDAD